MLPNPSEEQQEAINQVIKGHNVRIEAVAGAGKTTTLLFCARAIFENRGESTLILTYNKDLAVETNKRIEQLSLEHHVKVFTIHSYAKKLYAPRAEGLFGDKQLNASLIKYGERFNNSRKRIPGNIFIDEAQDLTEDFYQFISYLIKVNTQILLVGDSKQCINEYRGANSKYFADCKNYFNSNRRWVSVSLRTSYRLTPMLANFVNTHILGEDLIIGGNNRSPNVKCDYHNVNVYSPQVDYIVNDAIEEYGVDNIVFMTNSLSQNSSSPLDLFLQRQHDNILFYKNDVKDGRDDKIMKNKLGLYTFHSMKGLEKKCTILFGFDESFFVFADKHWPKGNPKLPNIFYVASTRSSEKLIIIASTRYGSLRTIKIPLLKDTCNCSGPIFKIDEDEDEEEYGYERLLLPTVGVQPLPVTKLLRHLRIDTLINALKCFECKTLKNIGSKLDYEHTINFGDYYENVRQYYGTVIPMIVQAAMSETFHWGGASLPRYDTPDMYVVHRRMQELWKTADKNVEQWMEIAVCHATLLSGLHFIKDQIQNYDWVDRKFISDSCLRLRSTIPKEGNFEYKVNPIPSDENKLPSHINLVGFIDYLAETELWEFKCVNELTDEDKIQSAIYISLYYYSTGKLMPCKLYNIRTDEMLEIIVKDPERLLLTMCPH